MNKRAHTGRIRLINGTVLTPSGWMKDGCVWIEDGKIAEITTANREAPDTTVIDAGGSYVVPGWIDLHVHGGAGRDFLEATPEAFRAIAVAHARYGTTTLFPTLAVAPVATFCRAFEAFREVTGGKSYPGASLGGVHLEGNYLNPAYRGAQDPRYLGVPDPEEYGALLAAGAGCIARWSAAPELDGALDFARAVSRRGIVVALAHTEAGYGQVKAAVEAGFTHVTHFYNAMPGVRKAGAFKREGTVESVYLFDSLTVETIADGIHLPPAVLQLVHKVKGTERMALVTDCCAAGAGASGSRCFDPRVIIEDGVAKLADRSALAGSIATTDRLVRTLVRQTDIPLADALRMASETPARIMGVDRRKGTLEKGKDADIVICDQALQVQYTFVEGRPVYRSEEKKK